MKGDSWSVKAHELRVYQARVLADILVEMDPDDERLKAWQSRGSSSPANLRGLPAIGRGVSGAVAGSDPLRALLAKESKRERRRR